uniref:Potassium channel domain-containing protein n=1 Tax=Anopheles stephensi TaxID=30069 RepID=A0A182YRH6_ANOST
MTNDRPVLHQQNWTSAAIMHLQSFEKEILTAMKKDGWDGNEDVDQIQWTFFGALFYSIIVITTIGYGHIAPKTYMGKISTIFYAILGIPLMLLCLSNIGDIMASSFRFLYWRVCCYVCTREPKRSNSRRSRSSRGTKKFCKIGTTGRNESETFGTKFPTFRGFRIRSDSQMLDVDDDSPCKTPILCNKYALDDVDDQDGRPTRPNPRSQSMPRQTGRYGDRLMPDRMPYYTEDNEIAENMHTVRKSAPQRRREPRPVPAPSPRIMSPMGFAVHRQARHLQNVIDDNSLYDDEWDIHSGELPPSSIVRPVPIWLCVFLVVSYIIAGAFMFSEWEEWSFLDSAYFCFITLTTIGFGDFVPAQGVKNDSEISIALCSLYLLFGIALLAMSFNLVQEEVISNVKSVARRLGILKEEEMDD